MTSETSKPTSVRWWVGLFVAWWIAYAVGGYVVGANHWTEAVAVVFGGFVFTVVLLMMRDGR